MVNERIYGNEFVAAVLQRLENEGERLRRVQAVVVAKNDRPVFYARGYSFSNFPCGKVLKMKS